MLPRVPLALACAAGLLAGACTPPDPNAYLEITELETYWVVDSTAGDRVYLAPAVRFVLRNHSEQPCPAIQATAVFRRVGEEETWGNDWQQVTRSGEPLQPGETAEVMMKSDGRYHSNASPEAFFEHELFKDARVNIFLRVGSSGLIPFAEEVVARQVGSSRAIVVAEP